MRTAPKACKAKTLSAAEKVDTAKYGQVLITPSTNSVALANFSAGDTSDANEVSGTSVNIIDTVTGAAAPTPLVQYGCYAYIGYKRYLNIPANCTYVLMEPRDGANL